MLSSLMSSSLWLAALLLALPGVAGCSRSALAMTDGSTTDGATVADASTATDGATCPITASSTLPGVSIRLGGARCRFTLAEVAAGVRIPYEVFAESDVGAVWPSPPPEAPCAQPGSSGLVVLERISGAGQSYCRCDEGRCSPPTFPPVSVTAGAHPAQLAWDGRNWNGPSDTATPEGVPFPPGQYTLELRAIGAFKGAPGDRFTVAATLGITLTP